jgi:hypothetical protein
MAICKRVGPIAFARGIKKWEDGEDFPPQPPVHDAHSDAALTWIGFMFARGSDFMARMEIAKKMGGDPETVKCDPPSQI